ncbi:MAG: MCE family protein [Desulfamplus sp.]|nr:MCE family protein [Desulfamplus sp.]
MSDTGGKTMVGAFVVGAVVLTVAAVVVFGSGSFFKEKNLFVLHFSGSVKGLNVGAPVVLRGVKIGSVRDIRINAGSGEQTFSIPVLIEINSELLVMDRDLNRGVSGSKNHVSVQKEGSGIENDLSLHKDASGLKNNGDPIVKGKETDSMEENLNILIKKGLRAQLEMQSLVTGQLLVALDFAPDTQPRFSGFPSEYLEIPTMQSDIEELTQKLKQAPIEEMFNKAFSIISNIDTFLNSASIDELLVAMTAALNSINTLAAHMDKKLPDLASALGEAAEDAGVLIQNADKEVLSISLSLKQAISDIQELAALARDQVTRVGTGFQGTASDARTLIASVRQQVSPVSEGVHGVLDGAQKTLASARAASDGAALVIQEFGRMADMDSSLMYNMNTALAEIAHAARSVRMLAEYIERHPEAFIQGKKN